MLVRDMDILCGSVVVLPVVVAEGSVPFSTGFKALLVKSNFSRTALMSL
jgi:hypothetical protein